MEITKARRQPGNLTTRLSIHLYKKVDTMITVPHHCPCCRTVLQRWSLSIYQAPVQVYWCSGCRRPVCVEPSAVLPRPALQEVRHA